MPSAVWDVGSAAAFMARPGRTAAGSKPDSQPVTCVRDERKPLKALKGSGGSDTPSLTNHTRQRPWATPAVNSQPCLSADPSSLIPPDVFGASNRFSLLSQLSTAHSQEPPFLSLHCWPAFPSSADALAAFLDALLAVRASVRPSITHRQTAERVRAVAIIQVGATLAMLGPAYTI